MIDAYICAARRTPIAKAPRGSFRTVRPDDMLAHVINAVLADAPKVDPEAIDDVIVGCAMPEAEQGMNVARIGLLLAGLPDNVPGVTVNRFCSSGIQTIAMAAERINVGAADLIIAGGTESMSMVPMMGHKVAMNPKVFEGNDDIAIAYGMGITAEKVAERWEVSREAQDEFAYTSHQRALKAQAEGWFDAEIAPYPVTLHGADLGSNVVQVRKFTLEADEGPRADTSKEALARLRPVFRANGTVTAGNSSQMSDGAGAVIVASEKAMKDHHLTPLARFAGFSVAGVEPEVMGIGPIAAIPEVLKRNDVKQDDLDWIELNEAFAAQSLAVMNELGLDPDKVNPNGGAISLGHPLGATGAVRAATTLHNLKRTGGKWGMVTMCVGTGMGAAGLMEMV